MGSDSFQGPQTSSLQACSYKMETPTNCVDRLCTPIEKKQTQQKHAIGLHIRIHAVAITHSVLLHDLLVLDAPQGQPSCLPRPDEGRVCLEGRHLVYYCAGATCSFGAACCVLFLTRSFASAAACCRSAAYSLLVRTFPLLLILLLLLLPLPFQLLSPLFLSLHVLSWSGAVSVSGL